MDNNQSSILNRTRQAIPSGRESQEVSARPCRSGGNLKSQDGFTLIEIGIAIFILAIGLIGMLTLFPIGIDSVKKVTQYSNTAVLSEIAISDLIARDIFNDTPITGTLTAGQTYTYSDAYPVNDLNQDIQFKDSFGTSTFELYSWQANLKNVYTNLVRAQVAVFLNFNPSQFGTGTANFTQDSKNVVYTSTLPSGLKPRYFIRADNDRFWYRIDSINTAITTIVLEGEFRGSTGAGLAFSTTDDMIDTYETMLARH